MLFNKKMVINESLNGGVLKFKIMVLILSLVRSYGRRQCLKVFRKKDPFEIQIGKKWHLKKKKMALKMAFF